MATSKTKRALIATAAVLGLGTAAVAVAHAPFARALLAKAGTCPIAAPQTPAVAESARHIAAAAMRGSTQAPARPALGFALDTTKSADVFAWAKRADVDCDSATGGRIRCKDVAPGALGLAESAGKVNELLLQFDEKDRLTNMSAYRSHLTAQTAADEAQTIVATLESKLGPPEATAGHFDVQSLSGGGAASIASVRYRYSDYIADVTAMNAPSGGPSILEHYMSATD